MDVTADAYRTALARAGFTSEEIAQAVAALETAQRDVATLVARVGKWRKTQHRSRRGGKPDGKTTAD